MVRGTLFIAGDEETDRASWIRICFKKVLSCGDEAARLPFMSAAPRPQRYPSSTTGSRVDVATVIPGRWVQHRMTAKIKQRTLVPFARPEVGHAIQS